MFVIDEETQKMKFEKEFDIPDVISQNDPEKWVNIFPMILKSGRCSHLPIPESLDDDTKAALEKAKELDPMISEEGFPFRSIKEHNPVGSGENATAWTKKIVGDKQTYNAEKGEGVVCYAVGVISSLRWPGAVTVQKGKKFTSIYLGYGIKHGDPIFNPTSPPEVQRDPDEPVQAKDPAPKLPPEEKKEEEGDQPPEDE
jgi:hypothetical protein